MNRRAAYSASGGRQFSSRTWRGAWVCSAIAIAACFGNGLAAQQDLRDERDPLRLEAVMEFADLVLQKGRPRLSDGVPLFVDGIHVDTGQPVVWRRDGVAHVMCNPASQQNLYRVLDGLTRLTGEPRYRAAAKAAIGYFFDNYQRPNGLLYWGGHEMVDFNTLEPAFGGPHELKNNFPYYDLMWAVDPEATRRFLRGFWNAHIRNWERLDMNRHGSFHKADAGDTIWTHSFDNPEPFFTGRGLTFINTGSDLIFAAGTLLQLGDEEAAWEWGQRLAQMYVAARHPDTGLGVYQYSMPIRQNTPPAEGPLTGELTFSKYGDRAENQFGAQFGDTAREGWALWGGRVRAIYVRNGFMQMALAEAMGESGESLLQWTVDGLAALAKHAYMPDSNAFRPMWADGTDLSGMRFARTGYYGSEGTRWRPLTADIEFLMTYARAHQLTGRADMWAMARQIGLGLGIGDIGETPGENVALEPEVADVNTHEVFAMLELYRAAPHPDYLERARTVADRLIERHQHGGWFLPGKDRVHANFDCLEPFAILALEATLRGQPEKVAPYLGGCGYLHHHFDGLGRTTDSRAIWPLRRE